VNAHLLGVYVIVVALAMIAPGPDMMFVLVTGARGGSRAGFLAACGVASSEVVHISLAAAGLSALFAAAPTAFTIMRVAGAAYLLHLGLQAIRSARRGRALSADSDGPVLSGRRAYLRVR
jgi:threonine/homoserine/homoserine lactone efflux protein